MAIGSKHSLQWEVVEVRIVRTPIARRHLTNATLSAVSHALVVIFLWFPGHPGPVHACKCAQPGPPSLELEEFSAVFVGRVVSVQHSFDPGSAPRSREDRTKIGFEVSSMWKGAVHEKIYATTPPTGGSCGFPFREGEDYVVYAGDSAYAGGSYTVGIFSRTALLGQAHADIAELGEGHAPRAGTGGPLPEQPSGHG